MIRIASIVALGLLAACATTQPYGPASRDGAAGYTTQQIETSRYRITYTDSDPGRAHDLALLRAAEVTLQNGGDWFEIVNRYSDIEEPRSSGGGTSVSVGGSSGSYGSSVGVGVGLGFPLSGGSSGKTTDVLEIVIGTGEKPNQANAYDARSVDINLRGSVS